MHFSLVVIPRISSMAEDTNFYFMITKTCKHSILMKYKFNIFLRKHRILMNISKNSSREFVVRYAMAF